MLLDLNLGYFSTISFFINIEAKFSIWTYVLGLCGNVLVAGQLQGWRL